MLKTIPKRLTLDFIVAKCDPSGETRYKLLPMDGLIRTHCTSSSIENRLETKGKKVDYYSETNIGRGVLQALRFTLMDLEGVIDSDTGKPLELKYETLKIYGSTYKLLREDSLQDIARVPELFLELTEEVGTILSMTKPEEEDADFTVVSSSENSENA